MKQLLRGEYKEVHYEEIYGNGSWSYDGSCSERMCADGKKYRRNQRTWNCPGRHSRKTSSRRSPANRSSSGVAEKESMVVTDADPTVTVCVYSVKSDKSGLKQNMDGIDGDELDAQELLDKMAEVGVIEEGITVDKFEQKDGALTLDLSSLKESSDKLVVMAIANTFIQNYEAKTLELSVAGEKIGDGPMSFEKNYKKVN